MFQLDMKSNKSVYEQVINKIKELVVTGALEAGAQLPSVRELSRQLTINPNTVQKAFKELERDGYIYTVSGKGTFVSEREFIIVDEMRVDEALSQLRDDFRAIAYLGLSPEKARKRADKALDEEMQILKKIDDRGGQHDKR